MFVLHDLGVRVDKYCNQWWTQRHGYLEIWEMFSSTSIVYELNNLICNGWYKKVPKEKERHIKIIQE